MNHERMQVKANLVSSHSPEVAACAAISPSIVIPACVSLSVKRALVFEVSLYELL